MTQVYKSTQTISKRFKPIKSYDDFLATEEGLEKLDSICMQLIAIGESLKNLDKITGKSLLKKYPEVEWKQMAGMRDVLIHGYFGVNYNIVWDVIVSYIPPLLEALEGIRE